MKTKTINKMLDLWENGRCLRGIADKIGKSAPTVMKYLNKAGIDTSKRSCLTKDTLTLIDSINTVLSEIESRMTIRQIFYQLATRNIVPLTKGGYTKVSRIATEGRRRGLISWDRIEDRVRRPHSVPAWDNLTEFKSDMIASYKKNIWTNQPKYFEVWLEKNALYGLIYPICAKYGITLQVITGYTSATAIYDASVGIGRFKPLQNNDTILYLGDCDPSGLDIERSIHDVFLDDHEIDINIKRVGLTSKQVRKYHLPPNISKKEDPRSSSYKHTISAELDALPPNILKRKLEKAIIKHLDIDAYNETMEQEKTELNKLRTSLRDVKF